MKLAFPNEYINEEIYVEQFIIKDHEDKILRLRKVLYGLKQAPRAWYSGIDNYIINQGFRRSLCEST